MKLAALLLYHRRKTLQKDRYRKWLTTTLQLVYPNVPILTRIQLLTCASIIYHYRLPFELPGSAKFLLHNPWGGSIDPSPLNDAPAT